MGGGGEGGAAVGAGTAASASAAQEGGEVGAAGWGSWGGGSGGAADAGSASAARAEVEEAMAASRGRRGRADEPGGQARRHLSEALHSLSFLVLFAGRPRPGGLVEQLRARGHRVVAVDKLFGGREHDLARAEVAAAILARVRSGEFDAVFMGTPCSSFSVAHAPQLRSRRRPEGVEAVPPEWAAYLAKHNRLADWSAEVAVAALGAGAAFAIENPADRGERDSPAFWGKFADHAPIWQLPSFRKLAQRLGVTRYTFPQCAFGAEVQKWTSILASGHFSAALAPLGAASCTHERHAEVAWGRDQAGTARAGKAGAYPPELCELLAGALEAAAVAEPGEGGGDAAGPTGGGRVADGAALGRTVAARVLLARAQRPRFASARNLTPAAPRELAREPLPAVLGERPAARPAAKKRRRHKGREAPPPLDVPEAEVGAKRPEGPIRIEQLWLDGLYEREVRGWLRLATEATADLRAGRVPKRVPVVTLGQSALQPWARGIVWDTRDPANCAPVVRSTRHTAFSGERQLDRAAFRRAADELGWGAVDQDILEQAGEGGVEVRSDCPLDTVLAFHHRGLAGNVEAVERVVATDLRESWVEPPRLDLPFVPCRVLPRNVVMQERQRRRDDGSIEHYLKPRVTQDSSDGGSISVNAGVPEDEVHVDLPDVRSLARAAAIIDTAGLDQTALWREDGAGPDDSAEAERVRAVGWAVDAESAFRFVQIQVADLWTQAFVWWGADGGVGFCVDTRLGFGGAYAVNRFERITTLVAALIERRLAAFDASQPSPQGVRAWVAERRRLQREGALPPAGAHAEPRYAQVYVDDFNGIGLDDAVVAPAEAEAITIDPAATRMQGGEPAPPTARAHVHARLAIVTLRSLGLVDAAGKTVAGDPFGSLGLRICIRARRVDCTPARRAVMLADAREQRRAALDNLRPERARVERFTGRVVHLTQVFPEVGATLHGGYRLVSSARQYAGAELHLAAGSPAQREWVELLDCVIDVVGDDLGVALAPRRLFFSAEDAGVLLATTDASGEDGVGGYVFAADRPGEVWIASEAWPADVRAALARSALPAAERAAQPGSTLSMPAAELFGCWAVAHAAARAVGGPTTAVISVGDCEPAANTLNAASSGVAQMRAVLSGARGLTRQWLGVAVPRELNVDADTLSHPARAHEVGEAAARVGLRAHWVRFGEECWDGLRAAIALGDGGVSSDAGPAARRRRRRLRLERARTGSE